jgi:hypothetical protein
MKLIHAISAANGTIIVTLMPSFGLDIYSVRGMLFLASYLVISTAVLTKFFGE